MYILRLYSHTLKSCLSSRLVCTYHGFTATILKIHASSWALSCTYITTIYISVLPFQFFFPANLTARNTRPPRSSHSHSGCLTQTLLSTSKTLHNTPKQPNDHQVTTSAQDKAQNTLSTQHSQAKNDVAKEPKLSARRKRRA